MRDSSERKRPFILFISSNRVCLQISKQAFGVVLDALMRPQPFLKLILKPSIVIFSPSSLHSSANPY